MADLTIGGMTTDAVTFTVTLSPDEADALARSLVDDIDASFEDSDDAVSNPSPAVTAYLAVVRAIAATGRRAAIVAVEDYDRLIAGDDIDDEDDR